MVLHPTQRLIAKDRHRFKVANCGRRWGKTEWAVEEIKGRAVASECRIAYIAPTFQQARDIAWEKLKKELGPIAEAVNESRLEIKVKTLDGKVSLVALRGWEAIETLRGQSYDLVVIDEVAMMRNFWVGWHEVIRPTLSDRRGKAYFISTPKGFNHFYDLYNMEAKDSDYKSFHFTTYDNPYIPKDEVDKARLELTEDRFAQEYLADFRKQEGLVYKEFSRDVHVYDGEIDGEEYFAGIDFGFHNPCAVLHIKRDRDNRYFVTGEWYKREQTEEQIAEYVKACRFNAVYPDPESPSAIKVLTDKGVNVREVIKNKDSVKSGINKVKELFKQNRLFIHRSCENLISELESYAYPEKRPDQNENENPIKENDHALDALRYALTMNQPEELTPEQLRDLYFMRQANQQNHAR